MMFLFLGFVVAFVLWYCVLPASLVESSFRYQTDTIQRINSQIVGAHSSLGTFMYIFMNNIKVMIFCVLFSFLFGAGAIFILTWNASVIAAAIGNFIRTNLTMHYLTCPLKNAKMLHFLWNAKPITVSPATLTASSSNVHGPDSQAIHS